LPWQPIKVATSAFFADKFYLSAKNADVAKDRNVNGQFRSGLNGATVMIGVVTLEKGLLILYFHEKKLQNRHIWPQNILN